jgi:hypothetical protein
MIGEGDCGAIGGMKIRMGNRSTRRKPAPAPLYPPQIPLHQTPGSNPGGLGGKPATNRLSYGAALKKSHGVCYVSLSQETHDVSATKINLLIVFGGEKGVSCGNHKRSIKGDRTGNRNFAQLMV